MRTHVLKGAIVGNLMIIGFICTAFSDGYWVNQDYRNLFVETGLATKAEVTTRIDADADAVMAGLADLGDGMAGIIDKWSSNVKAEPQAWALMAAVQADRQDMFDKLWKFAKTKMMHSDGKWAGFFAEQTTPDGEILSTKAKPWASAEQIAPAALYCAHHRWGSTGTVNYKADADAHILNLYNKAGNSGDGYVFHNELFLPVLHESWTKYVSTSHLQPGFCDYIAAVTDNKDLKAFYTKVATASRARLKKAVGYSFVFLPPIATQLAGGKVSGEHGNFHP